MMKKEIEKKYLVNNEFYKEMDRVVKADYIHQFYLNYDPETRIRIVNNREAWMVIKTSYGEEFNKIERMEYIYEVPIEEALSLKEVRHDYVIEKVRFVIPIKCDLNWEIDIYKKENNGLITAEIEFSDIILANYSKKLPPWIVKEITNDDRFKNSNLAKNPFCNWSDTEKAKIIKKCEI